MQVVVKQFSGLGNQMFQYAAGRHFAQQLGASLRIAFERSHRARSLNLFDRPMLLSRFRVEAPLAPIDSLEHMLFSQNRAVNRLCTPLQRALRIEVVRESTLQQHRYAPLPQLRPSTKAVYLDGYWQTHAIPDAGRPQLLREFTLAQDASGSNAVTLQQIRAAEFPVSIHIRRGDYALLHNGSLVLPRSYYQRAVHAVRQSVRKPAFFVFSDEPAYARTLLPDDLDAIYVEGNGDVNAQEDLRLMSTCRANIIANSSFSWWAAWLNPAKEKLVIAPKHWRMTAESYYPELCPPDWVLLDTAH